MGTTIPIRNHEDIETIKQYFLGKEQYRNYALFVVGINTALRISDLLSLEWKNVYDFEKNTWTRCIEIIEKKTGKRNNIFLNQSTREALDLYKSTKESIVADDKIFCNNRDRRQAITRNQAYSIIKEACNDCGIGGKISCHSLRKTFGYHAWKNNVPEIMLMNIYNHSSFAITKCYLGIEQDDKDDVFRRLNL